MHKLISLSKIFLFLSIFQAMAYKSYMSPPPGKRYDALLLAIFLWVYCLIYFLHYSTDHSTINSYLLSCTHYYTDPCQPLEGRIIHALFRVVISRFYYTFGIVMDCQYIFWYTEWTARLYPQTSPQAIPQLNKPCY